MRLLSSAGIVALATMLLSAPVAGQTVPAARDSTFPIRWPAILKSADSLAALDPAVAVDSALQRGDRRLWGVQGYSLAVPGVRDRDYQRFEARYGYRAMPNTSDSVFGEDHQRYIEVAWRYAREYNRVLLCRLRQPSQ